MLLTNLVKKYVAERNKEKPIGKTLAKSYESNLDECARIFSNWLMPTRKPKKRKCAATTADLKPEVVNDFLLCLLNKGCAPYTVKGRRTQLLVIWRFAVRERLTRVRVENVKGVHCPELDVKGYTRDQAEEFLNRLSQLKHRNLRTKIPRSIFWQSLVSTKWDVCLRIGDFPSIEVTDFDKAGKQIWITESKTGKQGWEPLSEDSVAAIQECIDADPQRRYIWPMKPKSMSHMFIQLARQFGFPGSANWIRKGSSSEYESEHPGQGWTKLRHSTPTIFPRHYRVPEICNRNKPMPPPLRRRSA